MSLLSASLAVVKAYKLAVIAKLCKCLTKDVECRKAPDA